MLDAVVDYRPGRSFDRSSIRRRSIEIDRKPTFGDPFSARLQISTHRSTASSCSCASLRRYQAGRQHARFHEGREGTRSDLPDARRQRTGFRRGRQHLHLRGLKNVTTATRCAMKSTRFARVDDLPTSHRGGRPKTKADQEDEHRPAKLSDEIRPSNKTDEESANADLRHGDPARHHRRHARELRSRQRRQAAGRLP